LEALLKTSNYNSRNVRLFALSYISVSVIYFVRGEETLRKNSLDLELCFKRKVTVFMVELVKLDFFLCLSWNILTLFYTCRFINVSHKEDVKFLLVYNEMLFSNLVLVLNAVILII
jgi:hypothetical protein